VQDLALPLAQAVLVALQACWLTLGVWDNMRHPRINRDDIARVLELKALEGHPDLLAALGHRRVTNPRSVQALFVAVIVIEAAVSVALWIGALGMLGALAGWLDAGGARALAILGVLGFTAIWAAFLIGGQWFYYWYGAFGQDTHFRLLAWGLLTLLILAA